MRLNIGNWLHIYKVEEPTYGEKMCAYAIGFEKGAHFACLSPPSEIQITLGFILVSILCALYPFCYECLGTMFEVVAGFLPKLDLGYKTAKFGTCCDMCGHPTHT